MGEAEKNKLTMVVFSGELDRALAAYIIATTAASMGIEVTMFFTFWGLNIIKKNEGSMHGKGWMRKMLNMMNRGGTKRLAMSKLNMMGMGTAMMKKMMKQTNMYSLDQLIALAKESGVKMYACTTTIGLMGLEDPDFIPEVAGTAGAAFFLGESKESFTTLFI
jgi:peroxiredoxin family protein